MEQNLAKYLAKNLIAFPAVWGRTIFAASFLLVAAISPQPARSQANAPDPAAATAFVASLTTNALLAVSDSSMSAAKRDSVLRVLVGEAFDLGYIGRYVLGARWQTLGASEREAYDRAFGAFITKLYIGRLTRLSGLDLQIVGAEIVPSVNVQDVLVASKAVLLGGYGMRLDWRVRAIDGRMRIIDIMVDGVSLAKTQRDEVGSVMQAGDIDKLIVKLRARST
jgi:phospholipid transport system substrate-binding protein